MSDSKLVKGMIIGAAVGGLISLCDRSTRTQFVGNLKKTGNSAGYFLRNPSVAVHNVRECYENVAGTLASGAESALEIMNQVQSTLENVSQLDDDDKYK
ncbi:hypothetical protein ERJ70_02735 [Sediminibacillus dalangtanensis]|uniref:Gas vesicle protein n=1 Tax=Sediminibacillus dalangtanensis TaxID=2729421 RepID=A0ABX7VNZ4_9BACI|nr:hypothetical protein [Sediminibacillus dalangtanensis]QTM98326.1 hypothetical protein ERJ70_02735 [Sediminibacillus dalangtanensis]